MDKFLDTCTLRSLNQEAVETLNTAITRAEVEAATNSLPTKVQMGSQSNSTRCTKRRWYHSFWNSSKQYKKRESFPKYFMRLIFILIPKPSRDLTRKENLRPISMMKLDAKIFNKILANWLQQHIKKLFHHDQVGFIQGMQDWFNIHQSINLIHHINRTKDKTHMIISIGAEKAFNKIQQPFMLKALNN